MKCHGHPARVFPSEQNTGKMPVAPLRYVQCYDVAVRRPLRYLAGGAAIVLAIFTIVFWIRSYDRGYLLSYQSSDRTGRILTIHWKRIGLWRGHIELTTESEQYHLDNTAAASHFRYWGLMEEKRDGFSFIPIPKELSMANGVGDIGTNRFGFGEDHERFLGNAIVPSYDKGGVSFPCWLMVFVLMLPLMLPMCRMLAGISCRTRRKRLGLCTGCGYDLRATPNRCPECGTRAKLA